MLCCETGGAGLHEFEDLAVFVSQLNAAGATARISVGSVPEGLPRNAQFDVAPYLFDGVPGADDRVLVLGAGRLTDRGLARLRRLGAAGAQCLALGPFAGPQAAIGASARLSYVFGRDPRLHDPVGPAFGNDPRCDCPVIGVAGARRPGPVPRLLLIAPDLSDASQWRPLLSLGLSRALRVAVLTDGKSKEDWIAARGTDIPFYHYGEILPASLAALTDLCVSFTALPSTYRVRCLIANLAVAGAGLVDGTPEHTIARAAPAFIRGPVDLAGLAPFLQSEVLPNLPSIAREVAASDTARSCAPEPLLRFLGESRPAVRASAARRRTRVVFMPTNGIGLGHAQRCTLVAAELDRRCKPVFAAFPSCLRLIKAYGHDAMPLVGRSPYHAQAHENDLVNYLRLRSLSAGAAALVFDGVYVFDSVYRAIVENRLRGVWIRRGLWQAGQNNTVALDREKAFERVIVPSEAFDELNATYSRGDHHRVVGPIVQRTTLTADARQRLRDRLAERFGRVYNRLVVTLLGGGVAADRGAQIQALCGILARRPDVLHLVVVWPGAVLQPGWFAWEGTRIVKTHHAGALTAAADLCIGAAGYNAFHEALYNAVPAIFVPQTGAMMDDQRARALAARERGLAGCIEPDQLMTLDREIERFLDDGKAEQVRQALAALELPEPGNAAAARLVMETGDGC
jgi:hypothetical protein